MGAKCAVYALLPQGVQLGDLREGCACLAFPLRGSCLLAVFQGGEPLLLGLLCRGVIAPNCIVKRRVVCGGVKISLYWGLHGVECGRGLHRRTAVAVVPLVRGLEDAPLLTKDKRILLSRCAYTRSLSRNRGTAHGPRGPLAHCSFDRLLFDGL